jgi:hypothetical protein
VGSQLRAAHAELPILDGSDRGIRTERHLHQAIEIGGEVDPAGLAVRARAHVAEAGRRRLGAATEWTEDIPAQVEEARAGRRQAELEHRSSRGAPLVGKCVRPEPQQGEVVAPR